METRELFDPEENRLALEERSDRIDAMLDATFDAGADRYDRHGNAERAARAFSPYAKLQEAFLRGWEEAGDWDDDDGYCCSQDSSMRDTHGVPGRDL